MRISKRGAIFTVPYLLPTLAAFSFAFYLLIFDTSHSEFAGIYPMLMTLPWSILLVFVISFLNVDSAPLAMLGLILGAVLNTTILYASVRRLTVREPKIL